MYGVMREDAWESGFLCFGVVVVAEEMGDERVYCYILILRECRVSAFVLWKNSPMVG